MRRATVILGLLVMSVCVFPARADAFFWDWLDDLSGPAFAGYAFNWRVWCQTDSESETTSELRMRVFRLNKFGLEKAAKKLSRLKVEKGQPDAVLRAAKVAMDLALAAADKAIELAYPNPEKAAAYFGASTVARIQSETMSNFAKKQGELTDEQRRAVDQFVASPPTLDSLVKAFDGGIKLQMMNLAGYELSLCSLAPGTRTKSFLSANIGIGHDKERRLFKDRVYSYAGNQVIGLGLSFHSVVTPYLTIGTGGGVAVFSSDALPTFTKPYVEPFIFDFRPFRLKKAKPTLTGELPELKDSWWRDFVAIRFSSLIFPTGFEPGRFEKFTDRERKLPTESERFPAEFVTSVGIHFDLIPILKLIHQGSK